MSRSPFTVIPSVAMAAALVLFAGIGTSSADPQSAPSAAAGSAVSTSSAPADWGSASPGAVRPLWAFEACAGEFMSSNVAANGFIWGGEQSCTESSPQTLEFVLENVTQGGDNVVGSPFKSWTGHQDYIHTTTTCQSSRKTLYREYAYGTANGVELQPFPATKGFYLNCYHAGAKGGCATLLLTAIRSSTVDGRVDTPSC
jgi:hypothetical protein